MYLLANSIAKRSLERSDTANDIASSALQEARRGNELEASAQAAQSARYPAAQAAVLVLEDRRANWDTEWQPQIWHRLTNRGPATAYGVRWQVLEAAPDHYGPEIGRPPVGLGGSAGSSGSTMAHTSSDTRGLLMPPVYYSLTRS